MQNRQHPGVCRQQAEETATPPVLYCPISQHVSDTLGACKHQGGEALNTTHTPFQALTTQMRLLTFMYGWVFKPPATLKGKTTSCPPLAVVMRTMGFSQRSWDPSLSVSLYNTGAPVQQLSLHTDTFDVSCLPVSFLFRSLKPSMKGQKNPFWNELI